jgi:hypothetical protein
MGMRFRSWLLIAALGAGLVGGAQAQSRPDLERCRAINDSLRRLGCYDGIPLSAPPPSRGRYEVFTLAELKTDALTLRGRFVEVTGWITPGEDLFRLGSDSADETTIPIDPRTLSRAERRSFLEACGDGCDATVQGSVRPVGFTTGIVADLLIPH